MCKWLLRTENAVSRGARYEVFKQVRIHTLLSFPFLSLSFDYEVLSYFHLCSFFLSMFCIIYRIASHRFLSTVHLLQLSLSILLQSHLKATSDQFKHFELILASNLPLPLHHSPSFLISLSTSTSTSTSSFSFFLQGMIKAIFTPQNRMSYLELSFDVMSFMQQLRRASGKQDFQVY